MQKIQELEDLLLKEIVEKNYDQDQFELLTNERYPNKDELSDWTLEELKQLIKEFQDQQNNITNIQTLGNPLQDQIIQNNPIIEAPIQRRSKLIPKKQQLKQIFTNTLTDEQAQKKGFDQEQMNILQKIKEAKCQIQFDNQLIFSEYEKQINCNKKQQYIKEDEELNFKITVKEEKKYFSTIQLYCIETLPLNWKVERTKEDFKTLEKMIQIYLPEYSGYIIQYDETQKFEKHLENALKIYFSKPKTRSLLYFSLFLNDDFAKQYHSHPFSHFTENEKKLKQFILKEQSTSSGILNIEFSKSNYDNYKSLQRFQTDFSQGYLELEKQFKQSIEIINQETQKMKKKLKDFQITTKKTFIQDGHVQKIPEANFNIFLKNISDAFQLNDQIQSFIMITIHSIKQKLCDTFKILEKPLTKCQDVAENIRKIYINDFAPTQSKFLEKKEIQNFLKFYGLKEKPFSNYEYETLSLIIWEIHPLNVDINFEYLQKEKDDFAYLISQINQEAQVWLEKLFKEVNYICRKNFKVLTDNISKQFQNEN
ncbi:unnamed protein product [Paramecium sonneborni]|uniref:PX domain protein n=1 Tax=Paramecium sonneborni TaxID=65129 RepID=A0A8S1KTW7_9CILI|nr:unnamed protein product [Paramecium sonneborni]